LKKGFCCPEKRFPTFAALVLVFAVLWLLSELEVITVDIPWWPVILIIISLGWIANHCSRVAKKK